MKKVYFLTLACIVALLACTLHFWHSAVLGSLLLVGYFALTSIPAGLFFRKYFSAQVLWPHLALGALGSVMTLSALLGAIVVLGVFNLDVALLTLAINGGVWGIVARRLYPINWRFTHATDARLEGAFTKSLTWLLVAGYLILWILGVYILIVSRSSGVVASPWQVVHPTYVYVFAGATLVLGLLIFSRLRSGVVLAFFILHSLLLHSYLPLTHTLLYGADGWRHIATEQRLIEGVGTLTPIISDAGKAVPSFDLGTVSYSQFWGMFSMLSGLSGISLLLLTAWFVPMLWSFVVPILIFILAEQLQFGRVFRYGLIFLSFLPFALVSGGSFSLPVSLGFCFWLLFALLLVQRLQSPERSQLGVLGIFLLVLLAGYALYGLVAAVLFITAEIYLQSRLKLSPWWQKGVAIVLALIQIFLFPLLEFVAHYSLPVTLSHWPGAAKQFFGNLVGVYIASGPRPHDIATGNIILNQVPLASFVPNLFTLNRWWMVGFMMVWWGMVLYGFTVTFKKASSLALWFFSWSLGSYGAYFVGRYFFVGDQVLTRRLEPILALQAVFLVGIAGYELGKKRFFSDHTKVVRAVVVVAVSVAIAASYTLGPDTQTVAKNEYAAMEYIAQREQGNTEHCVLGDTYPLLVLEALTKKEIIGGGFPISHDFAQPEQQQFYRQVLQNPRPESWIRPLDLTKTNTCWLVARRNDLPDATLLQSFAGTLTYFGDIVVLEYSGPSQSLKNNE